MNLRDLDDSALMAQIANKDEAALGVMYDRYHRLIMSIAFHVVGERQLAEEITLDIFVTVWEKAGIYDSNRAEVRTWLTRITRNRAIDVLRREKSRPHKHSISLTDGFIEVESTQGNPEAATDLAIQTQRMRTAVASLPDSQKEAVFMAYFRGYSQSEMAEALDIPLGTVKTRIRSAMHKLRNMMLDEADNELDKSN